MLTNPYLKKLNTVVFDIETEGFFAGRDRIISASLYKPADDSLQQFFAESPGQEADMLEALLCELCEYQAVISYNGDSFDLPFLKTRVSKFNIAAELPLFWSIDLYRWIKKYWPAASEMESLSQKSMEFALGLSDSRTDAISGRECKALYSKWLKTGDEEAKAAILLHNEDDVRQLAAIESSMSALPYHRIAFENGYYIDAPNASLSTGTSISTKTLKMKGISSPGRLSADIYSGPFHFVYDGEDGRFSLDISLAEGPGVKFVDMAELPFVFGGFEELGGFHSGFLILEENGQPRYKEINRLCSSLIESLNT